MLEERARDSKLLIVIAIAGCLSFLVLIGVFVGMGYVRQVTIFWKEDIRTTVEFTNILGKVRVQGIVGNGGIDPTLVMKAGDTPYILTVINSDKQPHMFYVEGLNVHTKLLLPGENDTITLISEKEATYSYYDSLHPERIIGKIISVRVESTD